MGAVLAVGDALLMPVVAGAFGTFVLFLFLGLGALPFTAALDRAMGKEKALLLYSVLLFVLTMAFFGAEAPPRGKTRPGKIKNMQVEALDIAGSPFDRPAFALATASGEGQEPRNFFQRYSDTSPLPPPTLELPPVLPLEVTLPPTVPGPAPGHRWVLRGVKPTIDAESDAGIADVPDAVFVDYKVQPGDVFDWLNRAGAITYIFISALNEGEGWVKAGQEGFDALARRLAGEDAKDIEVQFGLVGGEKEANKKLDPNGDGEITAGEVSIALNQARLTISATRTLTDSETIQTRRTIDNLFDEALLRNRLRLDYENGPKDVSALRRAAREIAKVGATGKEGGEGWRRAAELLEVALTEAKRVGSTDVRTEVLLELLEAYRALHDEKSMLRVLAEYVRTNPKRADGWTWLGDVALERMSQAHLALDYYREALTHNSGHGEALIGQGRALSLAGEHARAQESFRSASRVSGAKYFRALGALRLGELERAKSEVDALLVRNADDPEAILLRGCILYAIGEDLGSARAAFERVATMPDANALRARATYNLGLTCVRLGQKKAALAAFEKTERALQRGASPGDSPDEWITASMGLAFLAWAEDDQGNVTEHLETARREAPRSSYVEMFAGMHAAQEERFAKAKTAFDRALVLAPSYAELDGWLSVTYLGLARAAVESGADAKDSSDDFDRAVAFMERAADREGKVIKDAFAMRLRESMVRASADNVARRQRFTNALATVMRVLNQDQNREQPAALAMRGYCDYQLEDYDQCIRDLQQVLDVVPADAEETHPWYWYRVYAADRLADVKRWRSLEKKTVQFEGTVLTKDWHAEQSNKVKVLVEGGKILFQGQANSDGSIQKPTVSFSTGTLFTKATFEELTLILEVPGEVDGKFLNNNVTGIQIRQKGAAGRRAKKASGIGIFSDKGRLAARVGNGKQDLFKDGEVHRLLDENGEEIDWPSNGPVKVRIVREDADSGLMAIYLDDGEKPVLTDTISGFKRTRGAVELWIGGYSTTSEPFDVKVSDIEVIRTKD